MKTFTFLSMVALATATGIPHQAHAQHPATAPHTFQNIAFAEQSKTLFAIGDATDNGNGIYSYMNGSWKFYPGKTNQVELETTKNNAVPFWSRDAVGNISRFVNQNWVSMPGKALDLETSPKDGGLYMLNSTDRMIYVWKNNQWVKENIPNKSGKSFAIDRNGVFFLMDNAGQLFQLNNNAWTPVAGKKGSEVVSDGWGNIWIITNEPVAGGFNMYKWTGRSWATSAVPGTDIAAGSGTTNVYTIDKNKNLWHRPTGGTARNMTGAKGFTGNGITDPNNINYQDAQGDTKLHIAVRNANTSDIVRLLDQGADPNLKNRKGESALFDAVNSRKSYIAQLVLDRGANVDVVNNERKTPLHKAVENNDLAMMGALLDKGANVNATSPIVTAVRNNNQEATNMLLNRNANPSPALDIAVDNNNTALFRDLVQKGGRCTNRQFQIAVDRNNNEIATIALQNGAEPNLALDYAIQRNRSDLIAICLEQGASANKVAKHGMNQNDGQLVDMALSKGADVNPIVHWAIEKNQTQVLASAITTHGANADEALAKAIELNNTEAAVVTIQNGANADRAMPSAIEKKQAGIVQLLLENGAAANKPEYIKAAAKGGDKQIVESLLNFGADVNAGMQDAVNANHTEVVDVMLQRGADAKPQGFISSAASRGNLQMVDLLLQYGADPNNGLLAAVKANKTPVTKILIEKGADCTDPQLIEAASASGNAEVVDMLLARGADANNGMKGAVRGGHVAVLEKLIANGADPKKEEYVVEAVNLSKHNVLKVLLDAGAPTSYTNDKGENLLHIACQRQSLATTRVLLDAGLDVNATDNSKNAPLHYAASKGRNNIDLCALLVDKGANVNPVNNDGDTPLEVARGNKLKKWLKKQGGYKYK